MVFGDGLEARLYSGGSSFNVSKGLSFPRPSMHWAPTYRITVGYSSPVYRKMQLKEAARQPFPSTARDVRMIVWSREKGVGKQGAWELR